MSRLSGDGSPHEREKEERERNIKKVRSTVCGWKTESEGVGW